MVTTYATTVVKKNLNISDIQGFSFLAGRYATRYMGIYYLYYPTKRMNEIYYKQKTSKLDKSGKAPIFLEFNHDASTLVFATGEKCALSEWDGEKQKFRRSMPGYQQANESLQLLRERLTTTYRTLRNSGQLITSDQLREALRPNQKPAVSIDLATLYASYLADCKAKNYKAGTLKAMGVTTGRLRSFKELGNRLVVSGYTNEVHSHFLAHMVETLKLHPNTIAGTCKNLRSFFNWCKAQNILLHPDHATVKAEWMPSERIYLTESELQLLEKAALTVAMARVRDAFLFQCYAVGIFSRGDRTGGPGKYSDL